MRNFRIYGKEPYSISVVHGGPGAAGEMEPVALELSSEFGIFEPFQRAMSFGGQIEELKDHLESVGGLPHILVGFSWGAWLGCMTAAHYPHHVKKLILIGSGPFEEKYAVNIHKTRISRLKQEDRDEVESLLEWLDKPGIKGKDKAFTRLGELLSRADAYDPLSISAKGMECRFEIFHCVWAEAEQMRKSGVLLHLAGHIKCPVTAIHGEYDPHPAEGVEKPLKAILNNFRFHLLRNCGHRPWNERQAGNEFYSLLRQELNA